MTASLPRHRLSTRAAWTALLVLTLGATGLGTVAASADTAQVTRSPWQMHIDAVPHGWLDDGGWEHGDPRYYAAARVPAVDAASWQAAPDGEVIGFDGRVPGFGGGGASRLGGFECLYAVDYTYFQTLVTVPVGGQVDEFVVAFAGVDDGARISVFNAAHPDGVVVEGSYVYLGGAGTTNLASYMGVGVNRIVITQLDDCAVGNNLSEARIVLNGTVVAPVSEPVEPAPPVDPVPPVEPAPPVPALPPTAGYAALTPQRVLDTRAGVGGTAGRVGRQTLTLALPASVPAEATSVIVNLTATAASGPGYVTAYEAGTTRPPTSNLNFAPGRTQAVLAIVPVRADRRIALDVTGGATHLVADLVGAQLPGGFRNVTPERALDTRASTGPRLGPVQVLLPPSVPASATHVLVNVVSVDARGRGHLSARPSTQAAVGTSSLNYDRGLVQANLVPVRIGADRSIALTSHGAATNVVADVTGYWLAGITGESQRVMDTRIGRGASGPVTDQVTLRLALPEGTSSVVLNLTATRGTSSGHAVVHAAGSPKPATSNLNWTTGQTQANLVVVPVGADGTVTIEVGGPGTVHLVADLVGAQQ